ncbi:hypothetical protein TRFO_28696 [Tritrichomonas foetus]|uniref:UDENN domain-containing protein n=1 Tax=Tritrichomonas foetus TaxID=1144522 RepID=A0A1J4JXN8_9EUKA|nr:hypothetical protein TRFO_28696 [Tritrichomonas foetus]|eukprot:OHT03919.1 hypothetical protein TRFO_28696 [Tritrichomonas foetus]
MIDDFSFTEVVNHMPRIRRHSRAGLSESQSFDHSIHRSIHQKRLSQTFGNQFFEQIIAHESHTYDQFLIVGLPLTSDLPESQKQNSQNLNSPRSNPPNSSPKNSNINNSGSDSDLNSINEVKNSYDNYNSTDSTSNSASNSNSSSTSQSSSSPSTSGSQEATPKILMIYPSAPPLLKSQEYDQVVKFCFPNGFKKATPSPSNIISQFVFRLTASSKGTAVYGVCTHFNCLKLPQMFFIDNNSKKYLFCFCFLTTNPMLAPHFQYLSFLVLWISQDVRYIPHPDPSISFDTPTEEETELLPGLVWAAGAQRMPSLRIPRAFLTELNFYHRITTTSMSKQDFAIANNLRLVLPATDLPDHYILYSGLSYLFSSLSIKNIIKAYSLMLHEAHILFISSDLMKLTLSVLSAVQLLLPFTPNGTVMPVIPRDSNFMTLLESPVPFIAGLVVDGECSIPEGIAIIDLDKDTIIDKDNMPNIPHDNELASKIKGIMDENSSSINVPVKYTKIGILKKEQQLNQDYINFIRNISDFACPKVVININPPKYVLTEHVIDKIVSLFQRQIAPTVESLMWPCFVSETTDINNPVTVFNKDLFMDSVEPCAKKFYSLFTTTTIFQQFCDRKTDEKDALLLSYSSKLQMEHQSQRRKKRNFTTVESDIVVDEVIKDRKK